MRQRHGRGGGGSNENGIGDQTGEGAPHPSSGMDLPEG